MFSYKIMRLPYKSSKFKPAQRLFCALKAPNEQNQGVIQVGKLGNIATIGINRPEKRNSLDLNSLKLLQNEIKNFENDPESDIGIIHGIGGNFCAGYDLDEIIDRRDDVELFNEYSSNIFDKICFEKPMIAAVSGHALANGFELALMCDFRVVEQTALFGFYNRRFGFPIINGGTGRLPAMVGVSRALDLILTGRGLTADEAHQWGLVNRLVACGTALGQAVNLAQSITKFPPNALHMDRKAVYNFIQEAFSHQLQIEEKNLRNPAVRTEIFEGAEKFQSGIGKHGKFYNIQPQKRKKWEESD